MPLMVSTVVPTLVMVTLLGALVVPTFWLPKLRLVGTSFTSVPVPVRPSDWGFGGAALSAIDTAAIRLPVAVGLKLALMVHLAPTARLVPHVLLWVKSPGLVPVMPMLVMLIVALPVLVTVALFGALAVPSSWVGKVRLAGDTLHMGHPVVNCQFAL